MSRLKDAKFLWTDNHWNHENLIKIARPGWKNSAEIEAYQINDYNNRITRTDQVVVFLGDLGDKVGIERVMSQLNTGYKILIMGNHDKLAKAFYEQYFDEVYDHPMYYHKRILLSHLPEMVSPGVLNAHGHTHIINLDSLQHMNLSPEIMGFGLISMKIIEKRAFALPKANIKFLKEWYKDIQINVAPFERADLFTDERNIINVELTKILIDIKNHLRRHMTPDLYDPILLVIRDQMDPMISAEENKTHANDTLVSIISDSLIEKYQNAYRALAL